MRVTFGLSLLLVHLVLGIGPLEIPHVNPEPPVPEPINPAPKGDSPPEGSTPEIPGLYNPGAQIPGSHPAEGQPERDIGGTLTDILNAITSIVSEVVGGSTTVTSTAPLPTAAFPCLSAQSIFSSCASHFPNFNASGPTQQANCLCYPSQDSSSWNPGRFDGFLSSCNSYVQAQTQLSTLSGLVSATGYCTSVGNVRATGTAAAAASTPAASTATPTTTTTQVLPPTTGAASALSPLGLRENHDRVWWLVFGLAGVALIICGR